MLYPDSDVDRLRNQALQGVTQNVRARIACGRACATAWRCWRPSPEPRAPTAATCASGSTIRSRRSLYGIDDRAFFSVFLHGQLAVKSPQIEVEGQDSLMGRLVFRELQTLWETGHEFEDLEQWESEMQEMGRRFGISC